MARNEDGEFELILGNRQLLSVFFIVVILLGVFFTVGYIVGRNSAPVVAADSSTPVRAETKPLVVESATPKAEEPTPAHEAPVTTAQQQPPEPAKAEPEPIAKSEPPKAEPSRREPAKRETSKVEPAKSLRGITEPVSGGIYLQLSATRRAEAETYVDVLKKKGFPAIAAQVPENADLFRVLVGPLSDDTVNKTRSDLQGASFPGDKAIRKKF